MEQKVYKRNNPTAESVVEAFRLQRVREESLAEEFEQFCRNARALYFDTTEFADGKVVNRCRKPGAGRVKNYMYITMHDKRKQSQLKRLFNNCISAQNEWIDSDRRVTRLHARICHHHAKAWKAMMDYLRGPYDLPFEVPAALHKNGKTAGLPSP